METASEILLIGNSVRYLAQSARANGYRIRGVDAFGDDDTRAFCERLDRADSAAPRALYRALPGALFDGGLPWVYTAGFEPQPAYLCEMQGRNCRLMGNDPRVLRLQSDPRRWFDLLRELEIAVPRTCLAPPVERHGWLYKRAGGAGGLHVHRARDVGRSTPGGYFQAHVAGPLCSLVFAADGSRSTAIGFSHLLARDPAGGDFRFAGVISGCRPPARARETMCAAARRLTQALGLRGINGLDFVLLDGEALLLELNARPPASLELYESTLVGGGLRCHLAACGGRLPDRTRMQARRGMGIVYAQHRLRLGRVEWPEAVRDRPQAGTALAPGDPLCSVHVAGPDTASILGRLRRAGDRVRRLVSPYVGAAA